MKPADEKKRSKAGPGPAPGGESPPWMSDGAVRSYRRGQTIVETGSELGEWVAISQGAACLVSKVASDTRVAVAALWLGDVIGWGSPLGKLASRYDVTALVDVTTINIPLGRMPSRDPLARHSDTAQLCAATEARMQEQISMRLAGNGLQRLVSVLATLAQALTSDNAEARRAGSFSLPISQACIGELSGLSRRQAWIYLGQLAEQGWVRTSKTKLTLEGLAGWLALMDEVERQGLECIATAEQCSATLARLAAAR